MHSKKVEGAFEIHTTLVRLTLSGVGSTIDCSARPSHLAISRDTFSAGSPTCNKLQSVRRLCTKLQDELELLTASYTTRKHRFFSSNAELNRRLPSFRKHGSQFKQRELQTGRTPRTRAFPREAPSTAASIALPCYPCLLSVSLRISCSTVSSPMDSLSMRPR